MAMGGSIVPLTVDFEKTPIPLAPTIFQGVNIIGAKICNRVEYDDMFRFAARHKIRPTIQEYEMTEDGLYDAMEALRNGKAHYRGVAVV
jgi:D-arabinose 1-dehydrogenase-like Zn-dependent alcohol dehydrogenase